MRYVAAYLLAVLGGKASPAAADLEKILSSVGIEADSDKLKKVIDELDGKSVEDLIAQGNFWRLYMRHVISDLRSVYYNKADFAFRN